MKNKKRRLKGLIVGAAILSTIFVNVSLAFAEQTDPPIINEPRN